MGITADQYSQFKKTNIKALIDAQIFFGNAKVGIKINQSLKDYDAEYRHYLETAGDSTADQDKSAFKSQMMAVDSYLQDLLYDEYDKRGHTPTEIANYCASRAPDFKEAMGYTQEQLFARLKKEVCDNPPSDQSNANCMTQSAHTSPLKPPTAAAPSTSPFESAPRTSPPPDGAPVDRSVTQEPLPPPTPPTPPPRRTRQRRPSASGASPSVGNIGDSASSGSPGGAAGPGSPAAASASPPTRPTAVATPGKPATPATPAAAAKPVVPPTTANVEFPTLSAKTKNGQTDPALNCTSRAPTAQGKRYLNVQAFVTVYSKTCHTSLDNFPTSNTNNLIGGWLDSLDDRQNLEKEFEKNQQTFAKAPDYCAKNKNAYAAFTSTPQNGHMALSETFSTRLCGY
jgi:hypothetical protein